MKGDAVELEEYKTWRMGSQDKEEEETYVGKYVVVSCVCVRKAERKLVFYVDGDTVGRGTTEWKSQKGNSMSCG